MPLLRDWTDSLTVDALDAHGERFFTRLLMKVDDYGRTLAEPRLLKSRLFPLKSDIRETDITRWLAACQKAGLIRFYVDAKGRTILEVFKFGQRKRFMKSEFDPPEGQAFLPLASPPPAPAAPQKKFLPPTKEVEVEGKGSRTAHAPATPANKFADKNNSTTTPKQNSRALWQLLRDEETIAKRLSQEREASKPNPQIIVTLRTELKSTRAEIAAINKPSHE